jgi:protein tyrosine/serine phosphatase
MIRQHGLRTIVCLRGENDQHGWFRLERGVCEAMGVTLITPTVYSRGLLTAEEMGGLIAVVHTMELPALVHCKSGADRVGFFASLYRHARLGEPIEQASRELSIRYGHFRGAKTGVLDFMFACFSRSRSVRESFRSWVMRTYNPHAIQNQFRPWAVSDWVVDRILRRE